MIDAEHSYFQPAIEQLVLDLQRKYNCMGRGERPIIFGCVRACVLACNRRWAGRPQRTNGRRWVWARRGGWWGSVDQQLVVMTGADLFSLSLSLSLSLSHTHTHTHIRACVRACVRAARTNATSAPLPKSCEPTLPWPSVRAGTLPPSWCHLRAIMAIMIRALD
jgi:hypothetical protein